MTPAERRLLEGIERRADNLRRCATIMLKQGSYLPDIVALMGELLVRTLILLCGTKLRDQFFHWLESQLRTNEGICVFCENTITTPDHGGMCDVCWRDMDDDDRLAVHLDLLEREIDGPPS